MPPSTICTLLKFKVLMYHAIHPATVYSILVLMRWCNNEILARSITGTATAAALLCRYYLREDRRCRQSGGSTVLCTLKSHRLPHSFVVSTVFGCWAEMMRMFLLEYRKSAYSTVLYIYANLPESVRAGLAISRLYLGASPPVWQYYHAVPAEARLTMCRHQMALSLDWNDWLQ